MADGDNNILRFSELRYYDQKIKEYISNLIRNIGGGGSSSGGENTDEAPDNSEAIEELFPITLASWTTGTDQEIAEMINKYYNGQLSLEQIQEVWHVGDTREITISSIGTSGDGWSGLESHREQTVLLQILDFEHDNLTTPINNKEKALITVDLKNCLKDANTSDVDGANSNTERGVMNSTRTTVGGWKESARRKWCQDGFYNSLPTYIKNLVKTVDKVTFEGHVGDTITVTPDMMETTSDSIFLLSEIEVTNTNSYTQSGEGVQYELYKTADNRKKLPGQGAQWPGGHWWGRSPRLYHHEFVSFLWDGSQYSDYADYLKGIAPAFCL